MTLATFNSDALPEDDLNLLDLLAIIWSGKTWIAATTLIAFGMGAVTI